MLGMKLLKSLFDEETPEIVKAKQQAYEEAAKRLKALETKDEKAKTLSEPVLSIIRSLKEEPEAWKQDWTEDPKPYGKHTLTHEPLGITFVLDSTNVLFVPWATTAEFWKLNDAVEEWHKEQHRRGIAAQRENYMVFVEHMNKKGSQMDKLVPIPEYADVMTVEEFSADVLIGALIPSDGIGYFATATHMDESMSVWNSHMILAGGIPVEYTHVAWFNK